MMSISGIEAVGGFTPYAAPQIGSTEATKLSTGTSDVTGTGKAFGSMVLDGLDKLERVQDTSDQLAVKAATGDLNAIHDYTIAATEASTATQLAVSLRNQAIGAFTEIMHMQV